MNKAQPNEKVAEAIKTILNEVNTLGGNTVAETIAATLINEHRTLQQNFMREFSKALAIYSGSTGLPGAGAYDMRNQASIDFATKVKEMDHYFPMV